MLIQNKLKIQDTKKLGSVLVLFCSSNFTESTKDIFFQTYGTLVYICFLCKHFSCK